MTAAKPAAAPSIYVSGFCGVAAHERCRGVYAGCDCTCNCHTAPAEPEPEAEPDLLTELPVMDDLLEEAPTTHCPTCTCGDPR